MVNLLYTILQLIWNLVDIDACMRDGIPNFVRRDWIHSLITIDLSLVESPHSLQARSQKRAERECARSAERIENATSTVVSGWSFDHRVPVTCHARQESLRTPTQFDFCVTNQCTFNARVARDDDHPRSGKLIMRPSPSFRVWEFRP